MIIIDILYADRWGGCIILTVVVHAHRHLISQTGMQITPIWLSLLYKRCRLKINLFMRAHTCRLNSQTLKFTFDATARTAIIFSSTVSSYPGVTPNAQISIAFCNLGSVRFAVKS